MKELVTRAIGLAKPGKGGERMAFPISCMATTAAGGNKNVAQTCLRSKDLIIKGNIASQEPPVLFVTKPFQGTVKQFVIGRGLGKYFLTGHKPGNEQQNDGDDSYFLHIGERQVKLYN